MNLSSKNISRCDQDRKIIVEKLGPENEFIDQAILHCNISVDYLSIEDNKLDLIISFTPSESFAKTCDDNTMQKFAVDGYNRISLGLKEYFNNEEYLLSNEFDIKNRYFAIALSKCLGNKAEGLKDAMLIIKNIIASWSFGALSFEVSLDEIPPISNYKRFVFFCNASTKLAPGVYACNLEFCNIVHLVYYSGEDLSVIVWNDSYKDSRFCIENVALLYKVCYFFWEWEPVYKHLSIVEKDNSEFVTSYNGLPFEHETKFINKVSNYAFSVALLPYRHGNYVARSFINLHIDHIETYLRSIMKNTYPLCKPTSLDS